MIELSQVRPGLQGFLYPYDGARRFMSLSFHLAYLLSNGSYLPLHLLFGLWILLTGCFAYLITRRLVPQWPVLAYAVGALSITFGADQGVNWLGYTVQRQTTVLALAAVWLLLYAWGRERPWLLLPIAILQVFSLWTYEACLLPLLAAPVLLYRPALNKRRALIYTSAWIFVPLLKLASLLYSRLILHEQSYEAGVLAKSASSSAIAQKLLFLITHGFAFWRWPASFWAAAAGCEPDTLRRIVTPVAAGVLVVIASSWLVRRLQPTTVEFSTRTVWRVLPAGLLFLVLAYIPFALLDAPSLLRTQLVSAVPASIVMVALAAGLDAFLRARGGLLIVLVAVVTGFGLTSGLLQQLGLAHDWMGYRKILKAIVQAAPCLRDGTMIVMADLPARISYSVCANDTPFDPFRDVMWFNSGLQVLYPDTKLVGIYYRSDGSGSDSIRFNFSPAGATLDHAGIGLEGDRFDYQHMIAFRYEKDQGAILLDRFPETSVPGSVAADGYRGRERIACAVPPESVRHRLNW